MNPERKEILALPCLPGRLTPAETAWRLGFEPDHIPILVNLGLLKPLGRPPAGAVKHFASIEIEALRNDPKWLAKASDALREKWKAKNECAANSRARQTTSGNGHPLANAHPSSLGLAEMNFSPGSNRRRPAARRAAGTG